MTCVADITLRRPCLGFLVACLVIAGAARGATVAQLDPAVVEALAQVDSLRSAGEDRRAVEVASDAVEYALANGDSVGAGRLLTAGAGAEMQVRGPASAQEMLERAIVFARAASDSGGWMNALGYMGIVRGWQGDFDGSRRAAEQRLRMSRIAGDRESEAWSLTSLGYLALRIGEPDSAQVRYRKAVELFSATDRVKAETTALIGLGRACSNLGKYDEARTYYQRALDRCIDSGDWRQQSDALNNLGTLEYTFGDIGVAAEYFQRAYELNASHDNPRGTLVPASNIARARVYLGQYSDAEAILMDAIDICRELGFQDRIGMLEAMVGAVNAVRGRFREAARHYRAVLSNKGTIAIQRDEAAIGLARSLERMGQDTEAEQIYRDLLARKPHSEVVPQIHCGVARCLMRADRLDEAMKHARAAVEAARLHHAPIRLEAALYSGAIRARLGNVDAAYGDFENAVNIIEEIHRASTQYEWRENGDHLGGLVDLAAHVWHEDASYAAPLFDHIERLKARTLLERSLAPRPHEADSLIAAMPPLDQRRLRQDVMQPGEVLLDFAVGGDRGIAFAVTRDTLLAWEIPGERDDIVEQVSVLATLAGRRPEPGETPIAVPSTRELRHVLLGPAWQWITQAELLVIAPDGYVSGVPWPLVIGEDSVAPVLAPSATFWAWRRASDPPDDDRARPMLIVSPQSPGLSGVDREVSSLSANYETVRVSDAESALTVAPSQPWSTIHAAAHIVVSEEHPWRSGIVLDDSTAGLQRQATGSRAVVRAREIAGSTIVADVAFLSGCESATGRATAGEGVLGLSSAMLIAGARAVVGTLWPVDDAASAILADAFYKHLATGATVSNALLAAQKELRGNAATSHPFYWSGYVVIGDGHTTVSLQRTRFNANLGAALVVAALLIGALLFFFSRQRVTGEG